MEIPEGLKQLQNLVIYLEEKEEWKRAYRANSALLLMKEMAKALHYIQTLNDNEFGFRDPQISKVIDPVLQKFKEWK